MTQAINRGSGNRGSGFALALVAAATMLGVSTGAAAAGDMKVKVARHELATEAGRGAVEARIARAVRRACATDNHRALDTRVAEAACRETAARSARTQLAAIASRSQLASK